MFIPLSPSVSSWFICCFSSSRRWIFFSLLPSPMASSSAAIPASGKFPYYPLALPLLILSPLCRHTSIPVLPLLRGYTGARLLSRRRVPSCQRIFSRLPQGDCLTVTQLLSNLIFALFILSDHRFFGRNSCSLLQESARCSWLLLCRLQRRAPGNFVLFLARIGFLISPLELGGAHVLELLLQRFGNMAGVFLVMASAVRAMDPSDVDPSFMGKLAKMVTAEMITSKVCYF